MISISLHPFFLSISLSGFSIDMTLFQTHTSNSFLCSFLFLHLHFLCKSIVLTSFLSFLYLYSSFAQSSEVHTASHYCLD